MNGIYRFHPDGLPYTGHRGVPDTSGLGYLLTPWLESFVCRVPYPDNQFLRSLPGKERSYIKEKRGIAAFMRPNKHIVHKDTCKPVYRTKMQENVLVFPVGGDIERPSVPYFVFLPHCPACTAQGRLHGKRHENASVRSGRFRSAFWYNGIFPQTVESHPAVTLHLRAGIVRQHIFHIYAGSPGSHDFISGRTPERLRKHAQWDNQAKDKKNKTFHGLFIFKKIADFCKQDFFFGGFGVGSGRCGSGCFFLFLAHEGQTVDSFNKDKNT